MDELGELEKQHESFDRRKVRIIAISNDDAEAARKTQAQFPHLQIVADTQLKLANALHLIHPGAAPDGGDTNAPTTLLVDGAGAIRWRYRPKNLVARLSPEELTSALDATFPSSSGGQ